MWLNLVTKWLICFKGGEPSLASSRAGRSHPAPMTEGTRILEYPRINCKDSINVILSFCLDYRVSPKTETMNQISACYIYKDKWNEPESLPFFLLSKTLSKWIWFCLLLLVWFSFWLIHIFWWVVGFLSNFHIVMHSTNIFELSLGKFSAVKLCNSQFVKQIFSEGLFTHIS